MIDLRSSDASALEAPASEQALVSVIIPVRGPAPGLDAAVDSALAQTLAPFEVIVVDDGSDLPVVIATLDSRVRLLRLGANYGPSYARNRGVEAARGDWIAFLDADDFWYPGKLARQLAGREPENPILIACNAWVVEGHARRCYNVVPPRPPLDAWLLVEGCSLQTSGLILPRWLMHAEPFDERLRGCEDWDLVLRLAAAGTRIAYDEDCLYEYRRNLYPPLAGERLASTLSWLKAPGSPAGAGPRWEHY